MVTRKPVGPPLATSTSPKQAQGSNANPPYPTTPVLDPAKHLHSAKSIYSPSLSTSPAFDLIDMDEARSRPRRDSDVSSHGTWDSDEEEHDTPEEAEVPKPLRITPSKQNIKDDDVHEKDKLPDILRVGPVQGSQARQSQENMGYDQDTQANPWVAQAEQQHTHASPVNGENLSSNPYRQQNGAALETSQAAWQETKPLPPTPLHAPPAPPIELPAVKTPAEEMSNMSLGRRDDTESPAFQTAEVLPVPQQGRPPLASVIEEHRQESREFFSNNPWRRPSQEEADAVSQSQSPPGPSAPPPPVPTQQSQAAPQYAPPPGPPPKAAASTSLVEHDEPVPSSSALRGPAVHQQSHRPPPISTAQPAASESTDAVPETPQTRARNQRSEHYQIKHVNWYDASYSSDPRFKEAMRRSPILTQNANGPCPLLALVNALVLSTPQNLDTALIETLRTREQVSLGLLLDAVFDELMSGRRGETAHELPDVGELYSFLLALHTGMNVNPRFVTPAQAPRGSLDGHPPEKSALHPLERAQSKPGCFEETKEMRLYSTFNIPLIHGWTAPKDTPAYAAFARCAQTFEDAQNIQFAEVELEHKQRSEGLDFQEQQTLTDIQTIKSFLNTWPTQLTDYGLETISASLRPGQIAILFRNDHFSTLYKEPRHGALMTLVTDAGYSSHEEIVWESLVDVNGAASEMFSGDFRTVSHNQDEGTLNAGSSAGGEDGWQTVQSKKRYHDQRSQNRQGPLRLANGTSGDGHETPPPLPSRRQASNQDVPGQDFRSPASLGQDTSDQLHSDDVGLGVTNELHPKSSEQEDHDLALALQLQEEEEDQQRQAEQRRRREQELSEQFLESEGTESGSRPPIPPRRSGNNRTSTNTSAPTAGRPAINRPTMDPDAPPSYEQSASDRPYRPDGSTAPQGPYQQGNPLNAYDALRRQESAYAAQQSSATVNSVGNGGGPYGHGRRQSGAAGNRIRRRSSQMGAPGSVYGGPPGGYPGTGGPMQAGPANGRVGQAARVQDAEEKCCVM